MTTKLFWFRNDLRIEDNPALQYAIDTSDYVVPIYIFDETDLGVDVWGFPKIGNHRKKFIIESLLDLKLQLNSVGSALYVFRGDTVEIFRQMAEFFSAQSLVFTGEVTPEEHDVENKISSFISLECIGCNTLYNKEDLPFPLAKLSPHFTPFREKVEFKVNVLPCAPAPQKILSPQIKFPREEYPLTFSLDPNSKTIPESYQLKGGSIAARERVNTYFWKTKSISSYKITRNELWGEFFSSKLSAYLARGCISVRQVYWWIKQYEVEIEKNESTYWLFFELLWREYFKWVALQKGKSLFHKNGWSTQKYIFREDLELFERWKWGRTTEPLLNAFQKELIHTGFMSNRGRQIVSSYLVKNLQLDWRKGAAWFESLLLDYDAASNYGNWLYQAGVGNDPRKDRNFNLQIQTEKYDPQHKFSDFWNREV